MKSLTVKQKNQKGFTLKTRFAILSIVLTFALALPMFGQNKNTHEGMKKTDMKKHDMTSMMGKPTFETTTDGLIFKVWLMTQEEHKAMMNDKKCKTTGEDKEKAMGKKDMDKDTKEMKDKDMGMDKATKEAMMAGTHHLMLEALEVSSGKEIADASAKVDIVSPSKKNSTVDMKTMMKHFGSGITLDEKGEYQLTVSVNAGGVSKSTQFKYTVK